MEQSMIIAETLRGTAYPYSAQPVDSEQEFIDTIREFQAGHGIDPAALSATTAEAVQWLNNTYAQYTEILTRQTYIIGHSQMVDALADALGWNEAPQ